MSEKMIIFTMGIKEINEAVQKVLFEKGYKWYATGESFTDITNGYGMVLDFFEKPRGNICEIDETIHRTRENYKEITFRELCELPPVHDEEERLASFLYEKITDYWGANTQCMFETWKKNQNWCKVREKVEKKLGL